MREPSAGLLLDLRSQSIVCAVVVDGVVNESIFDSSIAGIMKADNGARRNMRALIFESAGAKPELPHGP